MTKKKCIHKKVYQNKILLSYPPQRRWICELCDEEGIDTIGKYEDCIDKYEQRKKLIEGGQDG